MQKPICEFLSKQHAFSQCLDMFSVTSKLPRPQWSSVITEWAKIKKKARLSSDTSVVTRYLQQTKFMSMILMAKPCIASNAAYSTGIQFLLEFKFHNFAHGKFAKFKFRLLLYFAEISQ